MDWGSPIDGRAITPPADLRNPQITPNGKIYGVSQMNDALIGAGPGGEPHAGDQEPRPKRRRWCPASTPPTPSPNFGADMWKRNGDPRSVGIDAKGRVWFTLRIRDAQQQPAWCGGTWRTSSASTSHEAEREAGRESFDPKTEKFENVDTCFSVDHNEFSHDKFHLLRHHRIGRLG